MIKYDKIVNESLKQSIIEVLTKNGGEFDQEYIIDDYFKYGIKFKYDILTNDGTDRLIVMFREDSEFAFMYDYYQVFIEYHNNYTIEEDVLNNEDYNQFNTNDIIENNSTNEGIKKLIELADNINKKGTLPHINIDSELKFILVSKIWKLEENEDIEIVCQTIIDDILKTCAIFFVESLPIMGIYIVDSENEYH